MSPTYSQETSVPEKKGINMYPPVVLGENYMEQRSVITDPNGVHFGIVSKLLPEMRE